MIKEFSTKLQDILIKKSEEYGKESGFVKRSSKLGGEKFAQGLIFGWQNNPESSLSDLKQTLLDLGVEISEQGLDKRFNIEALNFMELLLKQTMRTLNEKKELSSELLSRFSDIKVYDSTTIMLPRELKDYWTGNGGSRGSKTTSSLKLSSSLSLKTGSLKIVMEDGFTQDKSSELITKEEVQVNSLSIKDLGYFSLKTFREMSENNRYFCSRLKCRTKIFSSIGKEIDIVKLMEGKSVIDKEVLVGVKELFNCRLLVVRLPEELKIKRINKIKKEAKREGLEPSKEKLLLAPFNIFITNTSIEKLSFHEVLIMMISRWQIELLFKLWKSYCQIDKSRSKKPIRILIEVYAKLIGAIISHQLMIIGMWENIDRSMFKAIKTIQKNIPIIVKSFSKGINELTESIQNVCKKLSLCRIKKRGKNPSTHQFISSSKQLNYA